MSLVRILIVDDFEPWRRFVLSVLRKRPELQVVCETSDGLEAVQKAEELRPDLILLDIGLPRLNGIEAARRIREQPWGKNMTLVALTGWGQDEDRQRSREAGFDGHMVKPVEYDALMKLLASMSNSTPRGDE